MKRLIIVCLFFLLVTSSFAEHNYFKGTVADEEVVVVQKVLTVGGEKRVVGIIPQIKETTAREVAEGIYRAEDIPAYIENPITKEKVYSENFLGKSIEEVINSATEGNALCISAVPYLLQATEEYDYEGDELIPAGKSYRQITIQQYLKGGKKAVLVTDWALKESYSGEVVVVDPVKVQALIDISAVKPVAVEVVEKEIIK